MYLSYNIHKIDKLTVLSIYKTYYVIECMNLATRFYCFKMEFY